MSDTRFTTTGFMYPNSVYHKKPRLFEKPEDSLMIRFKSFDNR